MTRTLWWIASVLLVIMVLPQAGEATFPHRLDEEPVPLPRLLKNLGLQVKANPGDAELQYTLGRLYSLAFARGARQTTVAATGGHEQNTVLVPRFEYWDSILERRRPGTGNVEAETRRYLVEAILHYQRATQLAPNTALYWLGLGWMLHQGAAYAGGANAPFLATLGKVPARAWRNQALAAYRRAFNLSVPTETKKQLETLSGVADVSISQEAGQGMLQLLGQAPQTAASRTEAARIRESLKRVRVKVVGVTPIILPLSDSAPLHQVLAPKSAVSFDLAGDGGGEQWPWVGPNTGILVWDPEKTGRITSGRQLFGSVTWWIFWRDGYQALGALDDDQNGWLEGRELEGLAVWCDRNGNGVADPGEVVSVTALGITRIAVRSLGRSEGVLYNPHGLQRRDGSFLPTYDWTPTPLLRNERRSGQTSLH